MLREDGTGSPGQAGRLAVPPHQADKNDSSDEGSYLEGGRELTPSPSTASVRFAPDSLHRRPSDLSGSSPATPSINEADQSFDTLSAYSQDPSVSSARGLLASFKARGQRKLTANSSTSLGTVLDSAASTKSYPGSILPPRSLEEQHRILDQLGYPDELQRDHDAFSLFSICFANIGFLQGTLFGIISSSRLGGSAPFAIGWPLGAVVMVILSATLAEFASAFPVCGAMFTWTWKLCRASPLLRRYARFLSWVNGSFLFIGHLFTQILLAYQFATVFQGTLSLYVEYHRNIWKTIAIGWAEICLCGVITLSPISRSPLLWKLVACEIFVAFLVMVISLAASSHTKLPASTIFTESINHTNYENHHIVYLIHWISTCIATGQDVAAHMAEETKSPSRTVPLAVFWGVVVSYVLGWVSICVILACVPEAAQESAFTPGSILVVNLSKTLALVILILVMIAMLFQGVAQLLACSRFAWALARDKALPFSHYIRKVSKRRIPYVAVGLIIALTVFGLLFVAVGEGITQTLVLASAGTSLIIAYGMPCFIYLFADPSVLDEGGWRWTLRGMSKPMAFAATSIAGFMIVLFGFPQNLPITAMTFGWGPITGIFSFILMSITWVFYGNSHYAGPIKSILGPQIELPKHSSSTFSSKVEQTPSQLVGRTTRVLDDDESGLTDGRTTDWSTSAGTVTTLSYAPSTQTGTRVD